MSIWANKARTLEQNAHALVQRTADDWQAVQTALCPYDATADVPVGPSHLHLRDTIHQEPQGPYEIDVVEGTGLNDWRAGFLENGTVKMAARPHVTPSREAQRQPFNAGMRRLFG